ncbi:MAG: serine/threonine protein kinase, partial [Planctomycetota bacterium]
MQVCCPICETQITYETVLMTDAGVLCPKCKTMVDLQHLAGPNSTSFSADGFDKDQTWSMAIDDDRLQEGTCVGKFRVLQEIGRGGFGSVYKAFDEQLKRVVALKIPREDARTKMDAAAFLREAQMAASVRDPNIVVVHEVGTDRDRMYICSDFIHGVTLRDWLREAQRCNRDICRMMVRIARSLHRAHRSGLIHRDLKPANILVDKEGNPFITDFGLARRTVKGTEGPDSSRVEIVGTPGYMSPEQAVGKVADIGPQSDCYALGVMLY